MLNITINAYIEELEGDELPTTVNMDFHVRFHPSVEHEGYSVIEFVNDSFVYCKETPEQISELMKQAKQAAFLDFRAGMSQLPGE